jgi:hypothetical protein
LFPSKENAEKQALLAGLLTAATGIDIWPLAHSARQVPKEQAREQAVLL